MTPDQLMDKLDEDIAEGRVEKLVIITWIREKDGRVIELMLGSQNLDRADLLCASQSLRINADIMYRNKLEMGLAMQSEKH